MPTRREVLEQLSEFDSLAREARARRERVPRSMREEDREELQREFAAEEQKWRGRMLEVLTRYDEHPERFQAFFPKLEAFWRGAPGGAARFEGSVFVMTKFPINGEPEAAALAAVVAAVQGCVRARGYCPRIASEGDHHEWLWGNVETFLLGCAQGIAIVEDRYRPELNPNVAMEWGWMRGMGRRVLFLRERGFRNDRADWEGLIRYDFDWDRPGRGLQEAIDKFLPPLRPTGGA